MGRNQQGLAIVATIGAALSREDDVVAIEVTIGGERRRINRLPGETLADLEARANPSGCWRTAPVPIFKEASDA